uniref:hypothetical protein n=1 Tax=Komagataeibacter kakiaceti TaxID=943261 RepID=UPI000AF92912|nr:hypothetical protein [Komagataeibacter kakiaceti]
MPTTLKGALALAYLTNPLLRQERATLRATDEQVPQALGGWRPTITGSASMSYYSGACAWPRRRVKTVTPGSMTAPAMLAGSASPSRSIPAAGQQPPRTRPATPSWPSARA